MNMRVHLQGMVCLICGLALLGSLVHTQKGEAETYYVATDGTDSNPGTEERPFETLGRGVRGLSPGDTLYVKNGTYTAWGLANMPSGASWDNPITIAAYPGHSPVIVKSAQDVIALHFTNTSYIVIDGFFIDGTNTYNGVKITYESSVAHHIRIQNSEIAYAGEGIFVTSGSDGNEFINLQVHDNGTTDFDHGIYISSSDNIVEGCSIHDNMGWGVHLYTGSEAGVNNNIIRDNNIYDNGRSGSRGNGILLSSGSGNQAYNNDLWGNIGGIAVDYGASNTSVGGNTIHTNDRFGIFIGAASHNTLIESNDIYDNTGPAITNEGVSTLIRP